MPGSKPSTHSRMLYPDLELIEGRPLDYLVKTPRVRSHSLAPLLCFLHGYGEAAPLDLAIDEPDTWAALWPVDPTRLPSSPIDVPTWLSLGEVSRHKTPAFVRALELEQAHDGATGDKVWSDEGEDHVRTATLAYRDGRIFEWLLSKHR